MKRPAGFTILSIFLCWLAIAGFTNAATQYNSGHESRLIAILAFFYGVTSLTSAVGLWKLKAWAYRSFLAWSIVVVATMLAFQFGSYGIYRTPLLIFLGFSFIILALLALVARYIWKNLRATNN